MHGGKQTFDRAVHALRRGTLPSRILFEMLKQSTVWCGELLFTQFCLKMCFSRAYLADKMTNNRTQKKCTDKTQLNLRNDLFSQNTVDCFLSHFPANWLRFSLNPFCSSVSTFTVDLFTFLLLEQLPRVQVQCCVKLFTLQSDVSLMFLSKHGSIINDIQANYEKMGRKEKLNVGTQR